MIVFNLRCSGGHVFEGWFGSSTDYASQHRRGLVSCPLCDDREIEKAPMAPRVGAKGNQAETAVDPAELKATMAKLAVMQRKMLKSSDYVGDRFADEARAIHLGEADARSIHGKATRAETDSLIDDGIPVSPLPFPVIEPGEEN